MFIIYMIGIIRKFPVRREFFRWYTTFRLFYSFPFPVASVEGTHYRFNVMRTNRVNCFLKLVQVLLLNICVDIVWLMGTLVTLFTWDRNSVARVVTSIYWITIIWNDIRSLWLRDRRTSHTNMVDINLSNPRVSYIQMGESIVEFHRWLNSGNP